MQFKIATSLLATLIFSLTTAHQEDVLQQWDEFQSNYDKYYTSKEEAERRFEIFQENVEKMSAHNELYRQGLKTYEQGVNSFTDMTYAEVMESFGAVNFEPFPKIPKILELKIPGSSLDSIDWRTRGAVTEVKDQGSCRSCYAFVTAAAVESQLAIVQGDQVVLSEQNIIDCAGEELGIFGCKGGTIKGALRYIAKNGITSAREYPYIGEDGECKNVDRPKYYIRGFYMVKKNRFDTQRLVGFTGPAITVYTFPEGLLRYKSGIFNESSCLLGSPAHPGSLQGGLIVGYGTENDSDYWLVKNSWGIDWGDDGYFKIARGKKNLCGIVNEVYVPYLS